MSNPIQDGLKVKAWLDDELMKGVLATVAANIYKDFRAAKSSEERIRAQAKANALEEILNQMQAVASAGEREKLEIEKRTPKTRSI